MPSGRWEVILHKAAEPHRAKPAAVAGVRGGRWIKTAFQIPYWPGNEPACLNATTCNDFSHLCDTWRQQDPTLVAATSPASPRAPAVPRWPLLPTAAAPTCFQTFNLLTLRKPWEAGKVVLSSFYSGKHEWFPYKRCSRWQQRWDRRCTHQGSPSLGWRAALCRPPPSSWVWLCPAKCHFWQGKLCPPRPTPRGPAFPTLPPSSSLSFPLRVSTVKHSS